MKHTWIFLVLGAVLFWLLFPRRVHATVTVPQDEIRIRYKSPAAPGMTFKELVGLNP